MTVLRTCLSPWLPAASLLIIAGAAQAADAVRPPAPLGSANAPSSATRPLPAALPGSAPADTAHVSHGRFKDLLVYRPAGAPTSFVLFLSGDAGWNSAADTMARRLVQQGAMVAAIDWIQFKANLEADGDQCLFADGDLENLSHFVQAYFHTPTYLTPMLVGVSSGAAMAYAMLAQAPSNTFASALTLGFCPNFNLEKPLCKGSGLEFTRNSRGVDLLPIKNLGNPWVDLHSESDRTCPAGAARSFISQIRGTALVPLPKLSQDFAPREWMPPYTAAFNTLAARSAAARVAPPPASLSDLPIVEVPAQPLAARAAAEPAGAAASNTLAPGTVPSDVFAIIMSGDGGWAGIDQEVAAALSAKGIPVVGLDSLRYYWTARTPSGLAADTDRMIRYYLPHFGKQRVLLIGYSQGADVLPFAVNRLPQATRARVALTAVMGMSEHALFEFHVSSWVSDSNSGPATLPEIDRITGMPVLCIYGADESDSLCPKLDPQRFIVVKLKGGHHFDGDYANLAHQILAAANP